MDEIINVILWAALIQGLFLAILYIFSKKYRSFANFLLGMFLISLLLEAFTTILPYDSIGSYSIQGYFTLPEVKIFIPLFFLHFVLEKIGCAFKYRSFLKTNYVIASIISAIVLVNLYLFAFSSSSISLAIGVDTLEILHLVFQCYAFFIAVCAFVISIKETLRYRELVRNEYSDYRMLQINWLWQLIFMLLPATILWGLELLTILFTGRGWDDFVLITWGFVALFLYFLSYQAYRHQNLFDKLPESVLASKEGNLKDEKAHKCSDENSNRIKALMTEKQSFLNQDLTINVFAEETQISPRLISSCVNKNIGYNFNEWVNNFRVDKAIEIIKSDHKSQLSIEGIGSDSGFKSRSAMYAAFKKKTGHSPGYYRNN